MPTCNLVRVWCIKLSLFWVNQSLAHWVSGLGMQAINDVLRHGLFFRIGFWEIHKISTSMRRIVLVLWLIYFGQRWGGSDRLWMRCLFVAIFINNFEQVIPVLIIQISLWIIVWSFVHCVKSLPDCFLDALKPLAFYWFTSLFNDLREVILGDFRRKCGVIKSTVLVLPVVSIVMVHQLLP